jgi:Cu/Zn superoxide dismutase
MRIAAIPLLLTTAMLLAACKPESPAPDSASTATPESAAAPAAPAPSALTHGFHIHANGDCSAADGSSAGGHFNPAQVEHGSVDAAVHHGGDMSNIVADAQGVATIDAALSSNVNLGSGDAFDISGRGVIVHADPDDYTSQPTGNAGSRLACGVIATAKAL